MSEITAFEQTKMDLSDLESNGIRSTASLGAGVSVLERETPDRDALREFYKLSLGTEKEQKQVENGSSGPAKKTKTGHIIHENPKTGVKTENHKKINLLGLVGREEDLFSRNLLVKPPGNSQLSFALRTVLGSPDPGTTIRTEYGYILSPCPYGDRECNKPFVDSSMVVRLCEKCYSFQANKFILLKCLVDRYVDRDYWQEQMWSPNVNVDCPQLAQLSGSIDKIGEKFASHTGISELASALYKIGSGLESGNIDFTHNMENVGPIRHSHEVHASLATMIGGRFEFLHGLQHLDMSVVTGFIKVGFRIFVLYKALSELGNAQPGNWLNLWTWMLAYDFLSEYLPKINATLSDIFDDVETWFRRFKRNHWQEQAGGGQDAIAKAVLSYLYVGVVQNLDSEITLEDFLKKTMNFPRYKQGLDFTMEFFVDVVQSGLDFITNKLNMDAINLKKDPCPEATEWLSDTRELLNSYEKKMDLNWSLFNKVTDLRKRGTELLSKLEKRKELDRVHRFVTDCMYDLKKLLDRLQRASIVATGPRIEPVGVLIAGLPGVGKTTSSHNMMLAVAARVIDECDLPKFLDNHNDFIYNRVSEEEYFTGYHGQTIFYYDDIGVNTDVAGVNNSPFMEAIRAINSNNYLLHMAALEDKGAVTFNSKIVWATSNRMVYNANMDSLYEKGAFTRRWESFLCVPHIDFTTEETKTCHVRERKLDREKVDLLDSKYPHLCWYRFDMSTGELRGGALTYEETIREIVATYDKKYNFGKRLLDENERTKRREILKMRLEKGSLVWQEQGNVEEFIETEVERQMSERAKAEPGVSRVTTIPSTISQDKIWLYKYIREFYPTACVEDLVAWTNSIEANVNDFWDDQDRAGSAQRFEAYVRMMVTKHVIGVKPGGFLNNLQSKLSGARKTLFGENDQRLKKIAVLTASVATIGGMLAMFKFFRNTDKKPGEDDSSTDVDESSYAQSFSQRTKPKVHRGVKTLKPRARKRGHVQRVKGRDYGIEEQQLSKAEELLVLQAQMGLDKQAEDILLKVVTRSQYAVSSSVSPCYGYVTVVRGLIAIAPKHFMCAWKKGEEEHKANYGEKEKFILKFTRKGAKAVSREVALDEITFYDPEDMGDRDVIFMVLPKTFNPGPDIVKHFVRENELPREGFTGAMFLERKEANIMPVMKMQYQRAFSYWTDKGESDYWTNPDTIMYEFPTRVGDCGSWIVLGESTNGSRKLVGFHVAGRVKTRCGMGIALTQEELEDIIEEIAEVSGEQQLYEEWEPQCDYPQPVEPVEQFNTLESAEPIAVANTTAIVPSGLSGALESQYVAPALLRKKIDAAGNIIDPWINARIKYNMPVKYVDISFMRMCAQSYIAVACARGLNASFDSCPRVYTFEEAAAGLDGVPFFDGVPRHTSAGYPWCLTVPKGHRGKTHFFGFEGPYTFDSPSCAQLRQRVEVIIEKAKEGVRLKHVYADFLKDERRPLDKVETGKTRMISGSPIDYSLAVRMYFGDFTRWYLTNNVQNGSAVGVNVYGPDWTRIVAYLNGNPKIKNLIAGDFKSYDGSLSRGIQMHFLDMVETYYEPLESNPGYDKDKLVRKVLFEDIVNSKHIVERSIYEWSSSLPSGNPLTTVLNTFCNNVLIRYASLLSYSMHLGAKQSYPVMAIGVAARFLDQFEEKVRIVAYGDDNVISVDQTMMEIIDQQKLTESFAKFGFTYVDESKQGVSYTFRSLGEVSFLKRQFVREPHEDLYAAPLELPVVLEIPRWTKRGDKYDEIVRDNVDTALRELSLHKKNVWDKHAHKLILASRDRIAYVPKFTEYEVVREIVRSCGELLL